MTSNRFHVTGVPAVGPNVPPRKEFSDFAKDSDVLNLYLLALERIQNASQTELTSYFQLGGIHGKPYIPWDNVQGQPAPVFGGYCTHGSVIFPTWHRLYIVLYEQIIWNQASLIANSYQDPILKNKYQDAVTRLRQPYWDWAANSTLHPLLNTAETVTVVNSPDGEMKAIRNPLLHYRFHPIDPSFTGSFAHWPQTLRYPTTDTEKAESQPELVQSYMDTASAQLHDNTFNLLAFVHDWETFSNHSSPGNSLESIHDQVHNVIGGRGHMSNVSVAGFDPIFFLHHTSVDRLLALWQALNPNVWVTPGSAGSGSYTIQSGQTVDVNSDLTPFHIDDLTFWTSANANNTKYFGYTYPETSNVDSSPEELKEQVTKAVIALYGSQLGTTDSSRSVTMTSASVQTKSHLAGNPSSNPGHREPLSTVHPAPSLGYPRHYHDWYAEITVNPYQFSDSGYVHVFLCETVPPGEWLGAPEQAGNFAIFRNTSGECGNCNQREAAGETITGQVPLTHVLMEKGKDINNVDDLEQYFQTHMHWKCSLVDGSEVPLENVPSLQVKLCSALCERVEPIRGVEGFPRRHTPEVHHSVTHGKLGGYKI